MNDSTRGVMDGASFITGTELAIVAAIFLIVAVVYVLLSMPTGDDSKEMEDSNAWHD